MYKRILLLPEADGIDQPAVQRVLTLAGVSTAVEVFEIVHEPHLEGYFGHPEIYESLRGRLVAERLARAEGISAQLAARGLTASAAAVWDAPRHEALVRHVSAFGADLVVTTIGSGPGGALTHADWRTIAACPVPMLIVRSDGRLPYRSVTAAVDPFHAHGKPAELDTAILEHGRALRAQTGASLTIVHAYLPLSEFLHQSHLERVQAREADAAIAQSRRDALQQVIADAGLPAEAARLAAGKAEAVLADLAERGDADLLVIGAWSRGRLRELFLGSTAERVLERARTDVLVVKPPRSAPPR